MYYTYREKEGQKERESASHMCEYVMSLIRTSRVMTMKQSSHMYAEVMSHIHMSRIRMSHMGWLRLVGSLK